MKRGKMFVFIDLKLLPHVNFQKKKRFSKYVLQEVRYARRLFRQLLFHMNALETVLSHEVLSLTYR